jgi:hypothetical protein
MQSLLTVNPIDFDIAEWKAGVLRKYEHRSRVGNAVPISKSKPLNRKKAKAARAARKRK